MLLKAMEFYGLNEIPGEKNNPQIIQFFKDIGYEWVQTDETAWCGAFINWIAKQCDCQKSGRLDARSWLNIGSKTEKPQLGNIVVFWRESLRSWKGHVGIYVNQDEKNIYCLGGNQSNQVNIKPYPKNQLLGFRTLDYI